MALISPASFTVLTPGVASFTVLTPGVVRAAIVWCCVFFLGSSKTSEGNMKRFSIKTMLLVGLVCLTLASEEKKEAKTDEIEGADDGTLLALEDGSRGSVARLQRQIGGAYSQSTPQIPIYISTTPAYAEVGNSGSGAYQQGPTTPGYQGVGASSYCDNKKPPKCAHYNYTSFCFEDPEYPGHEIQKKLKSDPHAFEKLADVAAQSANDLVEYLDKYQEESFDYHFFNPGYYDKSHWFGPEGYMCPSDVSYGRPVRAQNVQGEWRVIVNTPYYTQTARFEMCLFPHTPCRMLAPCYKSSCLQKYVYERLLSYDPCDPYKGLFIDMYKVPSACSCHVPQYDGYKSAMLKGTYH